MWASDVGAAVKNLFIGQNIKYQGLKSKLISNICFQSLTDCADGSHQHGLGWVCVRACVCYCGVAWLSLCMYCQVNERLPLVSKLRFVYLFCSVAFSCHERPMKEWFYSCIRSCMLQHDATSVLIIQPPPVKTHRHSKGSEETSEQSLKVCSGKANSFSSRNNSGVTVRQEKLPYAQRIGFFFFFFFFFG